MKVKKAFILMGKIISSPWAFGKFIAYHCKQYRYNDLIQFANEEMTDKGIPGHGYVRVYDAFLRSRRKEKLYVCEIGLVKKRLRHASVNDEHSLAPSLRMWRKYLPESILVGFDIRKFKPQSDSGCITIQGDQSNRDDLQRIVNFHDGYDVIIDDALHTSQHQQISLSFLFPHLVSGGLYFIEDLRSQPPRFERKDVPKTLELLRHFSATGVWASPVATAEEKEIFVNHVKEVLFFESIGSANPREGEGALAVIVKK